MNFSRKSQLDLLEQNNEYDLLVIGGGIVGSAILELAASKGISTILLEKNDFASGASSRSTKLLHGGIRYLPQLQFGLVRESLKEQVILKESLGGLYKPLKLLAPIYKNDGFSDLPTLLQGNLLAPIAFKMGLTFYDFLGSRKKSQKHKKITKDATANLFPRLNQSNLSKSFIFHDAQTDDSKLVVTLLRNATEINNATALNYVDIKEISRSNTGYDISFTDSEKQKSHKICVKKIIAATGTHRLPGGYKDASSSIKYSGGAHLILEGDPLNIKENGVLLPRTEDDRVMFILPWFGNTIVGTTDTEYFSGTLDRPYANHDDKQYLIRHVKKYFDIEEVNYISSWSGVRALIDNSDTNSKNISRGHFLKEIDANFIQISGGKLTGFRIIAKESLEKLYNLEFKLNKLKYVDQILQLKNTINDEDVELCIKHYSVVKPTDYLLRRTRISWFNSNGGFDSISNLKNHFQEEHSLESAIRELKDEGLLD